MIDFILMTCATFIGSFIGCYASLGLIYYIGTKNKKIS